MSKAGLFVVVLVASSSIHVRALTFEERVAAQEKIERVYYSHQIGTSTPFQDAVRGPLPKRRSRTYLKQSVALDEIWNAPVTGEALGGRASASRRTPAFGSPARDLRRPRQ